MADTIERLATCARQLLDAGAEIERLTLECRAHKSAEERTYHRLITEHLEVERLRAALRFYAGATPADFGNDNGFKANAVLDVSAECRKELSDIDAFVRR